MTTIYSAIGQSVVRAEGPDKVTGKSVYVADIVLPGMLWGKTLRSPYPHARIVNINPARARKVPGVHAVLTGRDLPETRVGRAVRDCPVLARDRVLFVGDKVAAVAAEDLDAAEEALLLIEVEYEELPAVFDPRQAIEDTSPVLHPDLASYQGVPKPLPNLRNVHSHNIWGQGNIEQGFAESDLVLENSFTTQLMHQAYIEPHACIVKVENDGLVQVWANNKSPFALREQLSAALGISEDGIRLNPCSIGGDFGGKGSPMDVPLCYYLALHSGRPVKMVMDYIEEMLAANPRHPAIITLRTGLKRDGRLWAHQARVLFNAGAYGAFKPRPYLKGADLCGGVYRIPHVLINSYMVYTNNVPCGHMRAPGAVQAAFAAESHLDMVAGELGLDPYEFRLRNVLLEGDSFAAGEKWHHIRAKETLEAAATAAKWDMPKKPSTSPLEKGRERGLVGRGIAMGELRPGAGRTNATVTMDRHGKVQLLTALWDQGTGAHTILRQLVAEALTIPVDDVGLVVQDTQTGAYDMGSGGSRVTYTAGRAALGAAMELRKLLATRAAEMLQCPEDRLRLENGRFLRTGGTVPGETLAIENVAAKAMAATKEPLAGQMTHSAAAAEITSFCAQIAEVEVDPETGQVRVTRVITAHDVGTIINPVAHQGQIEGGLLQGLGYGLMEELVTADGRISTASLGDYKIPTIADVPLLVTVLVKSPTGPAPYQGKAIGEISNVPLAAAIANAVYDAVGVRVTDLPITAEKVLGALKKKKR